MLGAYVFIVRRQWHPTPVLLPGKSHGWRSLVGCGPWGCWGSDMTERLHFHFSLSCIGEGNGNPLRCSCLENPRDGGAWWAAVSGVAHSWTWLKQLSSSSSSIVYCEVTQSCPTLCDPVDCSLPGFSVHGILQARILEWVTISFSRGSSWPRDRTRVSCIGVRHFNLWATREAQNTGVGSLALLQGIFPTQGSNPGLPHCRQILYQLSHHLIFFWWIDHFITQWWPSLSLWQVLTLLSKHSTPALLWLQFALNIFFHASTFMCVFNIKVNLSLFFKMRMWLSWVLVWHWGSLLFSCGLWDLAPWPGTEPEPSALGVWGLIHWATKEVPKVSLLQVAYTWIF